MWNYNTNPNGGKAKEEASRAAQAKEDKKHEPEPGDCAKIQDPKGDPLPTIVDCDSAEAECKTGDMLYGAAMECGSKFDYGIQGDGCPGDEGVSHVERGRRIIPCRAGGEGADSLHGGDAGVPGRGQWLGDRRSRRAGE